MAQAVDFKGLPPVFKLKRIGESWGKWEMKIPIGNKLPIGGGAGAVHVQAATPPLPVRVLYITTTPLHQHTCPASNPATLRAASHGGTVSIRWRTARRGDVTL